MRNQAQTMNKLLRLFTDSAMPTSAQIVNWKFSQLDLSIDLQLQKSEVQDLRRMIKRRVDPKPCARTFSKFCDMNQDGNISQTEWSVCLAVNGGKYCRMQRIECSALLL